METEGNKVLAEFMGYRYFTWQEVKGFGQAGWCKHDHASPKLANGFLCRTTKELSYHTSWDWLMPVWIKFRDLEFAGKNEMLHSKVKHDLFHKLYRANSPSDFFHHLVEAVKWYQSTKK